VRKLVLFTWQYFIDHPEFLSLLATENLHRAAYLKKSRNIRHLHALLVDIINGLLERGAKQKNFHIGIDPVEFHISIAGFGFFHISNRHTLSTIFGKDLSTPKCLPQRDEDIVAVVLAFLQRMEILKGFVFGTASS
jgi:hypothetical protein